MVRPPPDLDALQELGFTEIETLVYACLLRESPATGYRISHAIGRPTPNTYKAIASLAQKGAVVVDDGDNRLCRAVPPDEVLTTLERRFQERKARARSSLEALTPATGDDRVYQLRTVDQVLERARSMLRRTREMALLDVFPGPFRELHEVIERAARRARVAAKVYEPCGAAGVQLVWPLDPERVRAIWPGQHLSLVRDAEEHLVALLSEDMTTVHQAVWSSSTFLSCMHHNHLASELMHTDLLARGARPLAASPAGRARRPSIDAGGGSTALPLDHTALSLTTSGVSGLRTLLERFGTKTGSALKTPRSPKTPKKGTPR